MISIAGGKAFSPRAIAASSGVPPANFTAIRLYATSVAGGEIALVRKNNHRSASARPAAEEGHNLPVFSPR
jgi:hypothetical protein